MRQALVVAAVSDDPALVHHGEPLQEVFDLRYLVLDDHDALAADVPLQHIDDALYFRLGQACKRFVEQQYLRLSQDRHRDLQASLFTEAEMPDLSIAYVLQIEV